MSYLSLICTLSFLSISFADVRTRTTLNLGWRFHLGEVNRPGTCSSVSFPISKNGTQCLGLTQATSATTISECINSCCNQPSCSLWQFDQGACWLGNDCTQNLTGPSWIGAASAISPPNPNTNCTGTPCDPAFDDTISPWVTVNAPHDFAIDGTFDPSIPASKGALPKNTSWYRRHFTLSSDLQGSLIWITFDGAFRAADVYINGAFVKHHEEGYTSFIAYIHNASSLLNFNGQDNVLAVHIDATVSELWCYEGGGLYRSVWLESASSVASIVPYSFYIPSIITGEIIGTDPTNVQTTDSVLLLPSIDVQSSAPFVGSAHFILNDNIGNQVIDGKISVNTSIGGGKWVRASSQIPISSLVKLWNVMSSPPLYYASIFLLDVNNIQIDSIVNVTIGIREALFDARKGFLLNGIPLKIRGFAQHVYFGGVGMAIPERVEEYQVSLLKSSGANAIRTAHNPVTPTLLDFTDQYGILVWEENRFVTAGVQPQPVGRYTTSDDIRHHEVIENGGTKQQEYSYQQPSPADPTLLQDAQDMVLRDRNHPSIIIWSLCNELGCVADSPDGGTLAIQFKLAILAADGQRPITSNTVQSPYLHNRLADEFALTMDVQSFSYEYTSYSGFHDTIPWKPVGGGEAGSCISDRGYFGPTNATSGLIGPTPLGSTVFECMADSWTDAASLDYVFGNFMWTSFGYGGETYPTDWPTVSSHFGAWSVDGFPKDVISYHLIWWKEYPQGTCNSIYVSPTDWTNPVAIGENVIVTVISCAPAIRVFVDNKELSNGLTPILPFSVVTYRNVQFNGGINANLTAIAYDSTGNNEISRITILPTSVPTQLHMWVEDIYKSRNGTVLSANGQDVALLGIELLDAQGYRVTSSDVDISVSISSGPGIIFATVNGNPADHVPAKSSIRSLWKGLLRVFVQSSSFGGQGKIIVTASSSYGNANVTLTAI
jgi:beta-galactosidase